jgi:hypothetical protein
MAGVLRIADAQAWVDVHGGSLTPDALAGELLTRFPLLAPQDYAGLLERVAALVEAEAPKSSRFESGSPRPDGDGPAEVGGRGPGQAHPGTPQSRARDLMLVCDGLEEAEGWDGYIARSRMAARDVIELAEALEAERSARKAAFAERDRWKATALAYSLRAQDDDDEPGP